jgi:3-methylfumaryl-CoA hydratase
LSYGRLSSTFATVTAQRSGEFLMSLDQRDLSGWIGKQELSYDRVTPVPITALAATLDREDVIPQDGDPVPPLWSWLYFLPMRRHSELGSDGHGMRGDFLPPVKLPRRMWAGGRLKFSRDLRVGSEISRTSTIVAISEKVGRTGPLVFVVVKHQISDAVGLLLTEEHDIVYRDLPSEQSQRTSAKRAPAESTWTREVWADSVMLFRYSALTFNGHRIHYDRRYATEIEKYPGLVVHGPLIATLLLDLLRREEPQSRVVEFSFRAIHPIFDVDPFVLCGQPEKGGVVKLWAKDVKGNLAMEASASLEASDE